MPSLLLIPGLNNTAQVFDGIVAGCGAEWQCVSQTNPALDSVAALAEHWLSAAPQQFFLCGFSFGGYVALEILARAPDRVQGFALMCSAPGADNDEMRASRRKAIEIAQTGKYEKLANGQAAAAFHPDNAGNEAMAAIRAKMIADYGVERFIAHQSACMARSGHEDTLRAYAGPVALIGGERDILFPPARMQALAADLPRASLTIINNAGHLVPLEQPEAAASVLIRIAENE